MTFDPKSFLKNLTTRPGIYQMLDDQETVIYVGKAKNLKNRVSSYFRGDHQQTKTAVLVKHIHDVTVTITASENEALLLEANLIKKLKPRYNVLFRDDKSFPYLLLSDHPEFPRLDFYRGRKQTKGRYFGPYPSAGAVRESLNLLQKLFKLRQCSEPFFRNRTRPCLQYQIKRCTAPCVGYIEPEAYQESVRHAVLFLEGKNQEIINELIQQMDQASEAKHYETAAQLRDQIAQLRRVQEQQYVMGEGKDADIIAVLIQADVVCVEILYLRGGRLIGDKAYFPKAPKQAEPSEVAAAFLSQFYLNTKSHRGIPPFIIINTEMEDHDWLEAALSDVAKRQVSIAHRVRGERAKWLTMAVNNAQHTLESHLSNKMSFYRRLESLQAVLPLESLPERIECFDISHTMGEATVASCVVFDREGPANSDYRRFNIKDITPGDDYAAMHQALTRRYTRIKKGEGRLPDLLVIDGGKGQLHEAEKVLESLQITGVALLAIAKGPARKPGYESLFMTGKTQAFSLKHDSSALHLLQQIRDEAHRFAITGHRQRRDHARKTSRLEDIEGVGAKRRRDLLKCFGGLQGITSASAEEIAKVPGVSLLLAQRIYDALH